MTTVGSTPRAVLSNRTNASWSLFTPDECTLKRRVSTDGGSGKKRARLENVATESNHHIISTHDVPMDGESVKNEPRNCTTFNTLRAARMRPGRPLGRAFQKTSVSSRPLLTSFVSSNKSDVYQLRSRDDPLTPGLPFACAFTTDAKRGGLPVLAVATQDGTVELLNVARRQNWDFEPQRTTIEIHGNAILDVKWGAHDQCLATSSGDSTTRITCVSTQQSLAVLAHHTSSVKSLEWDPNHIDLLSTASRDGSICVWDLRTANKTVTGEGSSAIAPVVVIPHAHSDIRPRGKTTNSRTAAKTVTSVLYIPQNPQQLISGGSFDGMLKQWDLRYTATRRARKPVMVFESYGDPTLTSGSRGRGISSLVMGRNHSSGLIWGMAADSCIHTYTLPLSAPFDHSDPHNRLTHPGLFANSFYVKLAASPCGSWLASGSSGGGVYLWDVASRSPGSNRAVELKPAGREIGAVDWARDSLAACCDDGTVRIWRPDYEVFAMCKADPEEKRWDWAWATEDL